MRYYFLLQYKMLNRHIKSLAIHPLLAYLIAAGIFFLVSNDIFKKLPYAPFVYLVLGVGSMLSLHETQRNDFLRWCYPQKTYRKIRLLENLVTALPFFLFFLYKDFFEFGAILLVAASMFSLFQFRKKTSLTIPTPFSKYPFEFMVGFRSVFYLFVLAYGLLVAGILSQNVNLAVFAIIVVFLVSLSFYMNTEDKFYVWIYSLSPKAFLFQKLKTAFIYTTALCLPIILTLVVFFPKEWWIVLIFLGWGYLLLIMTILMKYSVFPEKIMIKESLIFALNIYAPPLLFILIPYFYFQSLKKLQKVLT